MALPEFSGQLGEKNAAHLLRRVTFGPTVQQIKDFSGLTVVQAMDRIFTDPYPLSTDPDYPSPPIDTATSGSWVLPDQNKAEEGTNSDQNVLHGYFKAWHTDVMLKSDDPATGDARIKERIAWFYHTHLPARWTRINSSEAIYYQNHIFRHYALGNFKELFKKICIDNSMLKYLDGGTNQKNSPNENFAREMFELYSIGRGEQVAEGDYTTFTEVDVKAATKILTGWIFDKDFTNLDADHGWPTGYLDASLDETNYHDGTNKTFSSRFGGQTITGGTSVIDAQTELDTMIDMIFDQDATAQAITRKLYRFFVYHFIDSTVETNIIIPLATTLKTADYDITVLLKELFSSQFFYDIPDNGTTDDNIGALIKSPVDLVLGALRFFGTSVPDRDSQTQTFYNDFENGILARFYEQGLNYYEPFEVAGYPPYHQKPAYGRNWVMPAELAYRYQTGERLLKRPGYETTDYSFKVDVVAWLESEETATNITDASDAAQVIDFIIQFFLAVDLHTDRRSFFLNSVFLKDITAADWTSYWTSYTGGGSDANARERLEVLISSLMQTPEYQLH